MTRELDTNASFAFRDDRVAEADDVDSPLEHIVRHL